MFKIIEKIGGRKVFIILISFIILMIGFFLMKSDIAHYQTFCTAIVSISTGLIVGNVFEHKYNSPANIPTD